MAERISHFIFNDGAASSLKQALKLAGRRDRVFCRGDVLISCIPTGWTKINRVLGEAFAKLYDKPFRQTGAWALGARIIKLTQAGRFRARAAFPYSGTPRCV